MEKATGALHVDGRVLSHTQHFVDSSASSFVLAIYEGEKSARRLHGRNNMSVVRNERCMCRFQVEVTDTHLKTVVKAGGILDIVEVYPWTGEKKKYPRRDKKRGKHLAWVGCTEKGPYVEMTWGQPYAGWSRDSFELSNNGMQLTMSTQIRVDDTGEECEHKIVFKRV